MVEELHKGAGCTLTPIAYPFLCCSAGGAYSLLQSEMAAGLRQAKLDTILTTRPKLIASANIGSMAHLVETSPLPVRHWIELYDETLAELDATPASA